MQLMNTKALNGFVTDTPVRFYELTVEPGTADAAMVYGLDEMPRKRFERQYNILLGYAVLAAGKEFGKASAVRLNELTLPQEEGEDAIAAVWYSRARLSREPAGTVIAVYNGFGSLPGGFPNVRERAEHYLGKELCESFLSWVNAAKIEENDLAERTEPQVCSAFWASVDTDALCRALRQACLDLRA